MLLPVLSFHATPPGSTCGFSALVPCLTAALDQPVLRSVPMTDAAGTEYGVSLELTDGAYLLAAGLLLYLNVREPLIRWVRMQARNRE